MIGKKRIVFLLFSFSSLKSGEEEPIVFGNFKDMVTYAASGAVSQVAYAPFNYFQNQTIQGNEIAWGHPKRWFRGAPALALGRAPITAVQLGLYDITGKLLTQGNMRELRSVEKVACAGVAGIVSGILANVGHVVILHQGNTGNGFFKTIHLFPRRYKDLMRGAVPNVTRELLFISIYRVVYPLLKKKYLTILSQEQAQIVAGIASGIISGFITQPLNVIATTLHADIERKKYCTSRDVVKAVSLQKLFKGVGYRMFGIGITMSVLAYCEKRFYIK